MARIFSRRMMRVLFSMVAGMVVWLVLGLTDSPASHDLKRLFGEIHAGGLDLVIERVAGTGEDVVDAGELLSGFAHSVSICLDFLAAR